MVVETSDTPVNINSCTFTNNNGEAIVNGGILNVTNSIFTNNIAADGASHLQLRYLNDTTVHSTETMLLME